MTNEEAIKFYKDFISLCPENPYKEAGELSIIALEKQIPKKPVYYKEEHREENTYSKREFYKCPLCNNALFIQNHEEKTYKGCEEINRYPQGNRTKHCCFCGQAIDWSDKE